ncbi:hypothetical protein JMY91_21260 [Brenneria goodwinii]|nr:hypothetical protein [Brenneria goodwinii]
MRKKSSFPLELASSARIISDNLPGGVMHCCIKKSAAYGCQPQLPSGSRQAFPFPLLDRSLIKKPLIEGLFFCDQPPGGHPSGRRYATSKTSSGTFLPVIFCEYLFTRPNRWEKT